MVEFTTKFTGAKAKLFAEVCCNYALYAEINCFDKPLENPLFSWLSPYQRVFLVREVMVGLLCENEPLPKGTIQNYAAFRAIIQILKADVKREIDDCDDDCLDEDMRDPDVASIQNRRCYTKVEQSERMIKSALIRDRAEKNKRKMEREVNVRDENYEIKDPKPDINDFMDEFNRIYENLFAPFGTVRQPCRRPEDDMEKESFYWRSRYEDAFQEEPAPHLSLGFDFRCRDVVKWREAIDFLFVQDVESTSYEWDMVIKPINAASYADKSQHARIRAVARNVEVLRAMYDKAWQKERLAEDQRCIFAICGHESGGEVYHKSFVDAFISKLESQKIPFETVGNFQERLNVYKQMCKLPVYDKTLAMPFYSACESQDRFKECQTPSDYVVQDDISGRCAAWCGNVAIPEDQLMRCSQCKVVLYCSRSCQASNWPTHKKDCKRLAELRKNKEEVEKMAKSCINWR